MAAGNVKWFNNAKGYGFILPEGGGEDLFAHYSSIQMDGYKTLKAGQDVEFDVLEGPKGLHAVNIRAPSNASPETEPADPQPAEEPVSRSTVHESAAPKSAGFTDTSAQEHNTLTSSEASS